MSRQDYELDLTEFHQALRKGGAYSGDHFRQPEFQAIRCSGYSAINEGTVATPWESKSVRSYVARYNLRDYLAFGFAKLPREVRDVRGVWRKMPGSSIHIVARSNSPLEVFRPAGHEIANAGLYVRRDYLVDYYGLKVDNLPELFQDVFRGRPNARFMLNTALTPRSYLALEAIFQCRMSEPLRSTYWRAKYEELLAETVHALNGWGRADFGKIQSKVSRERHKIETAALIYRRDLGNAPSVAEMARKLGINRNRLIDCFKDMFGARPGEYAKGIRLDWAKDQLAAGVMTIGEAAFATGYSNASAFARAYGEHFGRPPSNDCDMMRGPGRRIPI